MTNAEKFEKVFGIKIDDICPSDPCDIIDHNICINANGCVDCPVHNFWEKEYKINDWIPIDIEMPKKGKEVLIFRDIARSLERIADHLTGKHIEEKSISELCETCYYRNFPDICREREYNMKNLAGVCYAEEREVQNDQWDDKSVTLYLRGTPDGVRVFENEYVIKAESEEV